LRNDVEILGDIIRVTILQPVIGKKIARITEAAENEIQKIPLRPDELYDYLYSVAPKE